MLQARWMPQKDGCCGPFWGAIALHALGRTSHVGEALDPDLVAVHAGTRLSAEDPYTSLPPGAQPRTDYRLDLPITTESAASGTSARRLAAAIHALGDGVAEVLPVAGPWSAHSVETLTECVRASAPGAVVLANWRTGPLWASRPPAEVIVGYLAGRKVKAPASEWDVGHFVNLSGTVRSAGRTMVVVRDSYPVLGFDGCHLQPVEAVAAALARGDGKEGGVLAVAPPAECEPLREALAGSFQLRGWDNGTPDD